MYYLNMQKHSNRYEAMLRGTKQLENIGIQPNRVAGFPVRNSEFVSQLQDSGKIFLNCTEHAHRPDPDPVILDLCDTEGLAVFSLDIGMYRSQLPKGFRATKGLRPLGALGCSISHLFALRRAYLAGDDYVLVSEDDVSWGPLVAVVEANTILVRKTLDATATLESEALAYVEAVSVCAASRAGGQKRDWEAATQEEKVVLRRAEVGIGMNQPVVVQMASLNYGSYLNWETFLNRQGQDCVSSRNGCDFLLRDRVYEDWGTQGLLWNRAAVEYIIHVFWNPNVSELTFPDFLPPEAHHPFADTLFYNLPHPFGKTFQLMVPVVHLVPHLTRYSTIDEGPGSVPASFFAVNATVQAYTKYMTSNCDPSSLSSTDTSQHTHRK
mmetsp:Transcript_23455/g.57885  ORF Transcript_23455/g.57885 Transcript_23455/m.57885 type:complete len:381 (+) Transcript_23455:575-1717(+)